MTLFRILIPFFFLMILISCKEEEGLSVNSFTPIEDIDPQGYFENEINEINDPSNVVLEFFRDKKVKDMANPNKPRPFDSEEITKIENISYLQDWTPLDSIFKFDWSSLKEYAQEDLAKLIKARLIFDNADLKVVELAIAPGAILPLHAQPTPSVYHILGGEGEVTVNDTIAKVYTGTSIKFDSYSPKRVKVTSAQPLKILWFSWAPEGDKSYLESGYYLTGSNLHIQPISAVMPKEFDYWTKEDSKKHEIILKEDLVVSNYSDRIKRQIELWESNKVEPYYKNSQTFRSESEVEWVDVINLDPKSFFFAKDISSLGSVLDVMAAIAKIKSVFRVNRPGGGYDLNYSYLAWGPQSKYVTHSHAICEFYYLLEGDVEYIINKEKYHALPGNFYFHPPYYDHEMRGLKPDVPFLSISGSWIPFGERALFEKPFYLLEDIQEATQNNWSANFDFHDFKMKGNIEFGSLKDY